MAGIGETPNHTMAAADGAGRRGASGGAGCNSVSGGAQRRVHATQFELLRAAQKDDYYCRIYAEELLLLLQRLKQLALPSALAVNILRPRRGNVAGGSVCPNTARSSALERNPKSFRVKLDATRKMLNAGLNALAKAMQKVQQPEIARVIIQVAYSFCCLGGKRAQTLGEEYCELQPMPMIPRSGPRLTRRAIIFATAVLRAVPFAVLSSIVGQMSGLLGFRATPAVIDEILSACRRTHLAWFFLDGAFLHTSNRFTGLRLVRAWAHSTSAASTLSVGLFHFISAILILQASVAVLGLWRMFKRRRSHLAKRRSSFAIEPADSYLQSGLGSSPSAVQNPAAESRGTSRRNDNKKHAEKGFSGQRDVSDAHSQSLVCLFCQAFCKVPTAAGCGHIFCWICISRWCQQQHQQQHAPTCPVCRTTCLPQELVPLRHFECSSEFLPEVTAQEM